VFCSQCGARLQSAARFCQECGAVRGRQAVLDAQVDQPTAATLADQGRLPVHYSYDAGPLAPLPPAPRGAVASPLGPDSTLYMQPTPVYMHSAGAAGGLPAQQITFNPSINVNVAQTAPAAPPPLLVQQPAVVVLGSAQDAGLAAAVWIGGVMLALALTVIALASHAEAAVLVIWPVLVAVLALLWVTVARRAP